MLLRLDHRPGALGASRAVPASCPVAGPCLAPRKGRDIKCPTAAPNRSFDAEDELDFSISRELGALSNPEKALKMAQHLDLVWKISRSRKGKVCTCCNGAGTQECSWCHGTGMLMIGDTMFCSTSGSCKCPVCAGGGYVKCEHCRGTGGRAKWMESVDESKDPSMN